MNCDYEKVLTASQLDKMKKDWVDEGKKQGALKAYDNIVKCLKSENQRFKEKRNPFLPNFELEQYSREQINEIKLIIKELKEKEGVLKENE